MKYWRLWSQKWNVSRNWKALELNCINLVSEVYLVYFLVNHRQDYKPRRSSLFAFPFRQLSEQLVQLVWVPLRDTTRVVTFQAINMFLKTAIITHIQGKANNCSHTFSQATRIGFLGYFLQKLFMQPQIDRTNKWATVILRPDAQATIPPCTCNLVYVLHTHFTCFNFYIEFIFNHFLTL